MQCIWWGGNTVFGAALDMMGPASGLSLSQSSSFHFLTHTLLVLVSVEKQWEAQTAFVATTPSKGKVSATTTTLATLSFRGTAKWLCNNK